MIEGLHSNFEGIYSTFIIVIKAITYVQNKGGPFVWGTPWGTHRGTAPRFHMRFLYLYITSIGAANSRMLACAHNPELLQYVPMVEGRVLV